jgi:hypothetical protein
MILMEHQEAQHQHKALYGPTTIELIISNI